MTVTSPMTPKPAATSASVTRVLATRGLGGDPGQQQAKPETSQRAQQLHKAGPQPTPGSAEPPVRAGSERLRHRARTRPRGNPSGNVLRPLSLICQLAGIRGGNPTRRRGLRTCPRTLDLALSISWSRLRVPEGRQYRRRCRAARRARSPYGGVTGLIV